MLPEHQLRAVAHAIPGIDAPVELKSLPQSDDDKAALYGRLYQLCVDQHVFAPVGFFAECRPRLGDRQPLVYKLSAPGGAGTDFGDQVSQCGSEGWVLTAQQLGAFLHGIRGPILGFQLADVMKQNLLGFGGTFTQNTPFGPSVRWWHSGYYPASRNPGELNTLVMSFSNGIDIALIVNSDFPPAFGNYGQQATDAFYDTMK